MKCVCAQSAGIWNFTFLCKFNCPSIATNANAGTPPIVHYNGCDNHTDSTRRIISIHAPAYLGISSRTLRLLTFQCSQYIDVRIFGNCETAFVRNRLLVLMFQSDCRTLCWLMLNPMSVRATYAFWVLVLTANIESMHKLVLLDNFIIKLPKTSMNSLQTIDIHVSQTYYLEHSPGDCMQSFRIRKTNAMTTTTTPAQIYMRIMKFSLLYLYDVDCLVASVERGLPVRCVVGASAAPRHTL